MGYIFSKSSEEINKVYKTFIFKIEKQNISAKSTNRIKWINGLSMRYIPLKAMTDALFLQMYIFSVYLTFHTFLQYDYETQSNYR